MTTRRQFLTHATLPVAAAVAFTVPAALVRAEASPDAELLAAFEEWRRATLVADRLPIDIPEDESKPYDDAVDRAGDQVEDLPARTLHGIAIKLRYLFAKRGEQAVHYGAILSGAKIASGDLPDPRDRMLWNLINDLERMASA